jgi:hypothetical protein
LDRSQANIGGGNEQEGAELMVEKVIPMTPRDYQTARQCLSEMLEFLDRHPNPALRNKVEKLLNILPKADVVVIEVGERLR